MRIPEVKIQRQTQPEEAERQSVPTNCVVNPYGSHLPLMGTVHRLPPGPDSATRANGSENQHTGRSLRTRS
ncbi:MAG: hypothetical protein KME60_27705 [Cyanomargarita calcarea GSE-NOS-MK-12-04C]|uniref:Uncharacterized protein n=1 Tax=Cyanomargarita calcarea GSE-NOS-MK-12-04C TaxID=2839659 RepID=A0A951QS69_9CYAN|nr:hypothetical protein [Cyanomargarita calcarea GSE-NOS-MK-12-04C]